MTASTLSIGIDVGGTKIAAGLVDPATGERSGERIVPTPERGSDILKTCAHLAAALIAEAPRRVGSIGIGIPEIVDPGGMPVSGERVDFRTLEVAAAFAGMPPAMLESDVRAAARGEARFGAGTAFRHWVYVSIGTGISSAIVTDGEPMVGARGAALVLASGAISFTCPECHGVHRFTLEENASGPAMAARWADVHEHPTATTHDAINAAMSGRQGAECIVLPAIATLGGAIGWLVNVTDPEAVILGGGLGTAGGWWGENLEAAIREHIWYPPARGMPIMAAGLGAAAGWVGAAVTAAGRPAPSPGEEAPSPTAR